MYAVVWSKIMDFVYTVEVNILRSVSCFVVYLHTFIDVVAYFIPLAYI